MVTQSTPFRAITMVSPDLDPGSGAVIIPFPKQRVREPEAPTPKGLAFAVAAAAQLVAASHNMAASFRGLKEAVTQLHATHRKLEADARQLDEAAGQICDRVAVLNASSDAFRHSIRVVSTR